MTFPVTGNASSLFSLVVDWKREKYQTVRNLPTFRFKREKIEECTPLEVPTETVLVEFPKIVIYIFSQA